MSTILVIDDDNVMRQGITTMLKGANQQVIEASDGQAGLEVALKEKPDLIVTDLMMPHMTGIEMLEQLRADDWGKTVPVVVLTADDSSQTLNSALESGITNYFAKTTDPTVLLEQILQQLPA